MGGVCLRVQEIEAGKAVLLEGMNFSSVDTKVRLTDVATSTTVREVDAQFQPTGNQLVAVDAVGAGTGELVLVASGSSARLTEVSKDKPVDAVISGIVDSVELNGADAYRKNAPAAAR